MTLQRIQSRKKVKVIILIPNFRSEEVSQPSKTQAVEPVEQRWEESAGIYTHKKFKKMASSVVVTTTPPTTTPPPPTPVTTTIAPSAAIPSPPRPEAIPMQAPPQPAPLPPRQNVIPQHVNFPLKHSALSLIEGPAPMTRPAGPHQVTNLSGKVHVPPPSPSSLAPSSSNRGALMPPSSVAATPQQLTEDGKPRKNVCPYCNISCPKPSVLDKHIRTHTNERPYPCAPCAIAFKTQSNLYKHCRSRTHALKVEKGIDSSRAEIVAELGDSFTEEISEGLVVQQANSHHHQQQPQTHQAPQPQQLQPPIVKLNSGSNIINLSQGPPLQKPQPSSHQLPSHLAQPHLVTLVQSSHHNPPRDLLIQRQVESRIPQLPNDTHIMSPGLVQAATASVQRVHYPPSPQQMQHGGAVLIKANNASEEPKDLSQHPASIGRSSIVQLPPQQPKLSFVPRHSVTILPQSAGKSKIIDLHLEVVIFEKKPPFLFLAPSNPIGAARPVGIPPQMPTRLPLGGSSINLTNSVELSARPSIGPDFLQQRIDKVISENQAIVETLDPLWPRRYMRQNSKDEHNNVLTMEKASPQPTTTRRLHPSSQVTMSLVTSSPTSQPAKNLQYHSTLSVVPASAVAASPSGAPLSIELTKPLSVVSEPAPPTAPPPSASSLVVLGRPIPHHQAEKVQENTKHHDLLSSNSVRELWMKSKNPSSVTMPTTSRPVSLVPSTMAHLEPVVDNVEHKQSRPDDGAMIRELLLKTKGMELDFKNPKFC